MIIYISADLLKYKRGMIKNYVDIPHYLINRLDEHTKISSNDTWT